MLISSKRARERLAQVDAVLERLELDGCRRLRRERALEALARAAQRCIARLSPEMSSFVLRSKAFAKCAISRWSKSSPPRCVSPAVALTSKTPSSIESSVTSNVPPPRS